MRTIYITGDSTVETNTPPYYGWGGQLGLYISGFEIVNLALSGRSSKSFLDEGAFAPAVTGMKPDDLLLVCFGHNDQKDEPSRYTDPETTFPQTLMIYVKAARRAGAVPVLCTSVSRNYFIGDREDFLLYTHGAYPTAVRELCKRENIALIDLEKETRALLLSLGAEKSKELYVNTEEIHDKTHFSEKGAQAAAKMVAEGLAALGLV